jgi:hypothetical protein
MGNACFCSKNHLIRDIKVDICLDRESFNLATEQVLINEDNMEEKHGKGILELKKYFDENEKEILNNLNKKEKAKKRNKKRQSIIGIINDNKYELMLKRLLEQKNKKRNGPKRRETNRKEDNIKVLVNEVLMEKNNKVINNKNSKLKNNVEINRNSSLIIKDKNNKNIRLSVTTDKNELANNLNNYQVKKKLHQQYLKNINTLNEMINEGTLSSGLCKKETNKKE